ncbi:6-phosphogluconolactonase [bacterium]|nr:MAG: 6-phosphogluconolactonase [bacterium]
MRVYTHRIGANLPRGRCATPSHVRVVSTHLMPTQIHIAHDATQLIEDLAEILVRDAREAIQKRGVWIFALSGGSTPKALYNLLASPQWIGRIDWNNSVLLFGDDRAVGPDDENSNYKMASEAFGEFIASRIVRIEGEDSDPDEAAKRYEVRIREAGDRVDSNLLGLGPDGHTASLFPHSPQLNETERRVVATPVSTLKPFVRRITMTYPEINNSRKIYFLITGKDKADRVQEIVNGPCDVQNLPATGIEPTDGDLIWFLDVGAATQLSR